MKLAIISDIHFGPSHESTNHPGYIRQDSELALDALKQTISRFNQLNLDAILQLGDLIIPENREADSYRLAQIFDQLSQSGLPIYSIFGNHDLDNLSLEEYFAIIKNYPINQGMIGNFSIDNWEFWWLNHQHNEVGDYLAESELNQVKNHQSNSKYRGILTHYPLMKTDVDGSFYFGNHPEKAKLTNSSLDFLWQNQPTLLLNGHLHFYSHLNHGQTQAITQAPFSENLQTKEYTSNHPQTYSILEIVDNHCQLSTYCGGFTLIRDVFNLAG